MRAIKLIKAFSLVELLVAVALFTAIVMIVSTFAIEAVRATANTSKRNNAIYKIKEVSNAFTIIKNDMWSMITSSTNDGDKHLLFENNKYSLVDGPDDLDGVTYAINISDVYRDINGNIIESGGTLDPHTRKAIITASWIDIVGENISVVSDIYVNDWNTLEWVTTTQDEFNLGNYVQTKSTNIDGGEVTLQQIIYPDWCKPSLAINEYDIPGDATAKTLFSKIGETYLGTGGNSNGVAFTKLSITGIDDPVINVVGEFNGYLTNNIFVEGNYAYLATTSNSKEVVILDISSTPYTEIGYFNTSRTEDANSVYVVGNIGYVAAGRYVFTFDLSSKTGSRSQLGIKQISLNQNWGATASVSQIVVINNYLYASLDQDWYELVIVNVTNPANMQISSQTSVNNQQTFDIYVSSDGNRTYFGTGSSFYEREFFILDTSSKSGARPTIGRYDTNGMSVKGIAIVEEDDRAVLVGFNGEEYQAVDISNESSPVRCGGMQLNDGINDVDSVRDSQSNSYSYILTNDTDKDFRVLRGGPGLGGDETGYGYPDEGSYISGVFDSTSSTVFYYSFDFTIEEPSGTEIKFQLRSGNTPDLSSQSWLGPDGTAGTYYENGGGVIPQTMSNSRYIQFKAFFTSDTVSTPILKEVRINYQK